jgi:hypothetical protein
MDFQELCNLTRCPCVKLFIKNMNSKHLSKSLKFATLAAILSYGANLHAITSTQTTQPLSVAVAGPNEFQPLAFSNSAEAGMLHRAYHILATGDHDYKGHRAKAMHAVEAAAKLLGLDLKGDAKDKEKQVLSDDKLREASGLLSNVLNSTEVKGQEKIAKHINEAIKQINVALSIK